MFLLLRNTVFLENDQSSQVVNNFQDDMEASNTFSYFDTVSFEEVRYVVKITKLETDNNFLLVCDKLLFCNADVVGKKKKKRCVN